MKFQNPNFKFCLNGRKNKRTNGRSNETVFMWLRFRSLDTYVAICLCVA